MLAPAHEPQRLLKLETPSNVIDNAVIKKPFRLSYKEVCREAVQKLSVSGFSYRMITAVLN